MLIRYALSDEIELLEASRTLLLEKLKAVGRSNEKPVYGADGKVDMAQSRRVSFRFIVNLDFELKGNAIDG